jgi:hypothetical protein
VLYCQVQNTEKGFQLRLLIVFSFYLLISGWLANFAKLYPKLKSDYLCKSLITIRGAYILKTGTCYSAVAFVFASAQPKLKSNCLCKSLITIRGAYILKAGTCYSAVAFVFASVQPNFSSLKHLPLKSINGSPLVYTYLCIFNEGFEVYLLIYAYSKKDSKFIVLFSQVC